MRKIVVAVCLLVATCGAALRAQTIIDLGKGGNVRSKTVDDYTREREDVRRRQAADSVAYVECLRRALNALHADSLSEAETFFEEALRLRPMAPANYVVRHNLGRISLARGDYRKAVEQFSAVLKERPDAAEARLDRAAAYLEVANPQAAVTDCNVLLDEGLLPEMKVRQYFVRGAAYMRQRLYARARTDFETCLRLDPSSVSAALLLASAYEEDGRPQEALERLNLFVGAHPAEADGLLMRARLEEKLGMDEAARADYDRAVGLRPDDAALYAARAEVLLRLGAKGSARKDLDEAVRRGMPRGTLEYLYRKL